MKKATLTDKQQRFVDEYLVDLNATQAAIRAGYSEKSASRIAAELLNKTQVRDAIKQAISDRNDRTQVNQDYVLKILCRQYEINAKTYPKVDFNGDPIIGEDGKPVMKQVDAAAANKAADMLAKHINFYEADNKRELIGDISFSWGDTK